MSRKKTDTPREKQGFNAITMRTILAIVLVAILLAMGGGFYLTYTSLQKTAEEVSQTQTQAQTSDARVQNLVLLERQLKENSLAFERAQQIVAESKSYQYQNQIITDLTYYANQAHVGITSFTFQDTVAAENTNSTPATSEATTENSEASSGSKDTATATPATPANSLKSTQVSIQLSEGVVYQDFLHFLHLIEQNLTRMQVADISMSKGEGSNTVGVQTLTIEVYIR